MVRCRILVPTHSNAGATFDSAVHKRFEARALELFGGFTYAGTVQGAWVDEDDAEKVVYHDTSRAYDIAVPSILDTSRVRQFAEYAAAHYDQRAIYVEVAGIVELFKPNWRPQSTAHTPANPPPGRGRDVAPLRPSVPV